MSSTKNVPQILIIDPNGSAALQSSLQKQYGLGVTHLTRGQGVIETVRVTKPDLIVLNARLVDPPADTLLQDLIGQQTTPPVVLIDANGDTTSTDFNYPHIIGWLSQPFTTAELALLIQTVLEYPLPASELVLAKRAELVDANQRLAHRLQELQTLFEIGKSVTSQLELKTVLRLVVEAAVNLTGAEESYLLLIDDVSGNLYLRAQANLGEEEAKDFLVKVKDSIAGQVVQSGKPVILSRQSNSLKVKTGLTVYSLVNVPVSLGDAVIGVLGVDNRHQKRAFNHDDTQLLAVLAEWSAIAIQNAKLYADTKQFSRDLQLVNEVSQLVSSTLEVEQIPRLLLQRTAEIVGAECGSLALIDTERHGVVFLLAYDSEGQEIKELEDFLMPPGIGIVGMVAQTGLPIIANEVKSHPAWSPLADQLTGFTTEKLIAVPLIFEGEILGVMELVNKKESDFVEDDMQLLSLVASSAASAIQNARQYGAIKRANEALREAQEQRIAAERWTVLGKAAANLAHRINNSTALVPIAAQRLQELLAQVELQPELRQKVDDNLERIRSNSLYTVDLAVLLLRRFDGNPTEAHDINQLVERALAMVEIPDNIKVTCQLDPELPAVDTSDLLVEVFMELFTNAIRQMGRKADGLLRIASFINGRESVSVQVTDNGPGISEEDLDRIFDLFFTRSPSGLGFGLWWVKTFLEQQHGEIAVESGLDENTTFTVSLPRTLPPLRVKGK
jgi:signal transduction histidine kinase/DNA-binding response OmpR family regulator